MPAGQWIVISVGLSAQSAQPRWPVMLSGRSGATNRRVVRGPHVSRPITADGQACCAPGSTPTGNDTCQLPSGSLAASCPLAQLTYSGTCCPPSSTPQSDGTCRPHNGSSSALACPLGQLDKGGLTCCPFGQVPQANGSCQLNTPTPTCPTGFTLNNKGQCLAALVCPGFRSTAQWRRPVLLPGSTICDDERILDNQCVGRSSRLYMDVL